MIELTDKQKKELWGDQQSLQPDSYATGQKLVAAYLRSNHIVIEITDGSSTWKGRIPLPIRYIEEKT